METVSNAFAVLMGVGTVFVGLIIIIFFCKIIGFFCSLGQKDAPAASPAPTARQPEDRQQLLAAVSAVLAEELGTDVKALRIHTFKKL